MNKFLTTARRLWPLTLAFGFFPLQAVAWSGYVSVTIANITIYQAGLASPPGALIVVSPATPADTEGCSQSGKGSIWIDWSSTSQPDGKALYATLLAAEFAGKTVTIGVNGCASNGVPLAYGITAYP